MHNSPSTVPRRLPQRRWLFHRQARRGFSYILVVGTTFIVATLGLGAILATRAQSRTANTLTDAAEARLLAVSAINLARLKITNDPNWRTTYAGGQFIAERTASMGKYYTWKILDEFTGGPVTANELDSVRVIGKGRVGLAVQLERVVLNPTIVPLDVLRTTVHSNDRFNLGSSTPITTTGGPVSSNSLLTIGATITGAAESVSYSGSASVTGGLTSPAPIKPMPAATVFDTYKSLATQINWAGSAGKWDITWPLLSSGINPSGGPTNPNGIYYIVVTANRILRLEINRIRGTLLVECDDGASVQQSKPICWEPHAANLPILLIKHTTNTKTNDYIGTAVGAINEATVGANLNPSHTPYNGVSDATIDATDIYPSQLKGLIHVISPSPITNGTETSIGNGLTLIGTLISDQPIGVWDGGTANLAVDANLFANPPKGYYTIDMVPSSGSWRADILP